MYSVPDQKLKLYDPNSNQITAVTCKLFRSVRLEYFGLRNSVPCSDELAESLS